MSRSTGIQRRAYHLRKRYGISLAEYSGMLLAQKGKCAICQRPPADRPLAVDHSASTGEVRGLLCLDCNTKLGVIEDEQFMLAGKIYLRQHGVEFIEDAA